MVEWLALMIEVLGSNPAGGRGGGEGVFGWGQNSAHDCMAFHCTEPSIIIFLSLLM